MSDRIGILVEMAGAEGAIRSAKELKATVDQLNNKRIELRMEKATVDREVSSLKSALSELTNKRRSIRLELSEASRIDKEIKSIEGEISKLTDKKHDVKITADEISKIDKEISDLQGKLKELEARRTQITVDADDLAKIDKQIIETRSELDALTETQREIRIDTSINNEALYQTSSMLDDLEEKAYSLSEALSGIGGGLSSFGNAVSGVSNITDGMGKAFYQMADLFSGGSILDTIKETAVTNLTNAIGSNWQSAQSRADILSTYTDYMDIMGVAADESSASLDKLNKSIQGLPIGLDEGAFQIRKYNMYLDDLNKATDLAIGLDKALIAGGASQQMRTTTKYQIDRLLAVGELGTARQWNALIQGLGVSVRFLQEEMGYAELSTNEFVKALSVTAKQAKEEGAFRIAPDEFLAGIERLADSQSLNGALDIYRGTLESVFSNIQFAITRGKANLISALDDALDEATGKRITDWALDIRDVLNNVFSGIADYIRANPEKLESFIEKFKAIFQRLADFNWGRLADKILDNLGRLLDTLVEIFDRIPDEGLEDFIAFATTWAGPLGKAFQALSNGLPFMIALFQRMKDFDFGDLADRVFTQLGKVIDVLVRIMEKIPDDVLAGIITFGLVWASPLGKAIGMVGGLISGIAKFAAIIKYLRIGNAAQTLTETGSFLDSLKGIATKFIGATAFIGVMAELGLVIRQYAHLVEEIGAIDTGKFSENAPKVAELLGTSGAVTGIITAVMSIANKLGATKDIIVGELETAGIFALMDYAGSIIRKFSEVAAEISSYDLTNMSENWRKVQLIMEETAAVVGVITGVNSVLSATVVGGLAELAGTGLTALIMENMRKAGELISQFTQIAAEIADVDMPTDAQIDRMQEVFDKLEKVFSGDIMTLNVDRGKLDAINSGLETVRSVAESVSSFEQIEGIDVDFEGIRSKVEEVATAVADIYTLFSEAFGDDMTGNAEAQSASQAKIVSNMATVVENLGGVAKSFNDIKTQIGRLEIEIGEDGNLVTGSKFDTLKKQVEEVGRSIGEIFNAIKDSFGGSSWWTKSQTGSQSGIVANMNTVLENLDGTITAFNQIKQRIGLIGAHGEYILEDFEAGNWFFGKINGQRKVYEDDPFQALVSQIEEMAEGMGRISDAIDTSLTPLGSKFKEIQESLRTDIVEHWNDTMNAIGELITSMANVDFHGTELGLDQFTGSNKGETAFGAKFVSKVEEVLNGMQRIANALDPDGAVFETLSTKLSEIRSSLQTDIVENWTSTMGQIGQLIDAMSMIEISKTGVGIQTAANPDQTLFERKVEEITKVVQGMRDMIQEITGAVAPLDGLMKKWTSDANQETISNIALAIEQIGTMLINLQEAMKNSADVDMDGLDRFKEDLNHATSAINDIMSGLITTGLADGLNLASYKDLAANLEQVVLGMEQIRGAVIQIFNMQNMLGEITESEATSNLKKIIEDITSMFDDLGDLDTIKEQADKIKEAVDQINEMVGVLASMGENLEATVGGDVSVTDQISQVVQAITSALGTEDIAAAKQTIQEMNSVIGELNSALSNLAGVDLSGLGESLGTVSGQVDTLQEHLGNLESALARVADESSRAKRELANVGNMAEGQQGKFAGLIRSLASLTGQLSAAAGNARSLASAINSIPSSKDVTVRYTQTGSPTYSSSRGVGVKVTPNRRAMGGLIQAFSTGGIVKTLTDSGIVDMRKVGTDTVPAMLTPGEFVVKKAAVDKYGPRFFDKVNGLNLDGAFEAVMSRLNLSTGTVVNNYYTQNHDSHAQFTQNFYRETANHQAARAHRYLRARL